MILLVKELIRRRRIRLRLFCEGLVLDQEEML